MAIEAPVIFSTSVESLARMAGPRLTETARARFIEAGIDFNRVLPAYPLETWVEALKLSYELFFPGLSHDEASYQLGRELFEAWAATLTGRALVPLLTLIGPKRGLERMSRNLQTSNNYSRTVLTPRGATEYELQVNLVAFPHYYRGLIEAGMQRCGTKNVRVEVLEHTPDKTARLLISW